MVNSQFLIVLYKLKEGIKNAISILWSLKHKNIVNLHEVNNYVSKLI